MELSTRHGFKTQQFDGVPAPAVAPDDKRVLLVEDEPLVSMMLADMLSAFGHKVDGPYNRFSDAILAAKSNDLQAGILDVNLGGKKRMQLLTSSPTGRFLLHSSRGMDPTASFPHLRTHLCCKNRSRPQSCTHCCSKSFDRPLPV